MSKKALLPQSPHHILLYNEDWEFLAQAFGPGSAAARIGISGAIRHVVHQRVLAMKAKANGELDRLRDIQAQEAKGAQGVQEG